MKRQRQTRYEVIVGNVGTVYTGPDEAQARKTLAVYIQISKRGAGRAARESVTLFENGDIIEEYEGGEHDGLHVR